MKHKTGKKFIGRIVSVSGTWMFVKQVSKRLFIGVPEGWLDGDLRLIKVSGDFVTETFVSCPENNFQDVFTRAVEMN